MEKCLGTVEELRTLYPVTSSEYSKLQLAVLRSFTPQKLYSVFIHLVSCTCHILIAKLIINLFHIKFVIHVIYL